MAEDQLIQLFNYFLNIHIAQLASKGNDSNLDEEKFSRVEEH